MVIGLVIAVVGLPALAWTITSQGHDPDRPGVSRVTHGDRGQGPPSWAHGHHGSSGKDAAKAWKQLTPEQRTSLMQKLAREHRRGMLAWGECVAAAKHDCERSLPPGLAKRH
jgi:hypothetical protein